MPENDTAHSATQSTEYSATRTTEYSTKVVPLRWVGDRADGHLEMLDQRRLPAEEIWHAMSTAEAIGDGIRDMVVRGAPAIGIAAAFGVAIGVRNLGAHVACGGVEAEQIDALFDRLSKTRPTAVNLFWALARMRGVLRASAELSEPDLVDRLFQEAQAILDEDRANNLQMGKIGADLFPNHAKVLTHCNTGGLATGGYGTALGVIRALHAQGKLTHVWIDETRPYLQGARLTAWECMADALPSTLITDSMAAHFMKEGEVDAVVLGTDRVAANGDVANKIGTYGLAVLCKHHGIPFYVAAPISTIDLETQSGDAIEIEQRGARELTHIQDRAIAPEGMAVAHPAFDITPAALVTAIITEKGVARPPYAESLKRLVDED